MSTQIPLGGNDGEDFGDVPDARVSIDLKRVGDAWITYGPGERQGIIGSAGDPRRAAEDYCRRVAEEHNQENKAENEDK